MMRRCFFIAVSLSEGVKCKSVFRLYIEKMWVSLSVCVMTQSVVVFVV